jgi:hypothetical protein
MSDLSDLAEEAAGADDAVWFKDNCGRIISALAEAVELEKRVAEFEGHPMKACHDYVETVNLSWEKVNQDLDALKTKLAQMTEENTYQTNVYAASLADLQVANSELREERDKLKAEGAGRPEEQRIYCPKGCGLMYLPIQMADHSCMDS